MRVAIVQGTRPEIIKNYAVVEALRSAAIPCFVLHTNQHIQTEMSGRVYEALRYAPDCSFTEPYCLGQVIRWLQETFRRLDIDHVILNGDTAAALAGAIAALYSGIAVTHIEAGLRSRDKYMLEERNRIMVDAIADLLFAYTEFEARVLSRSADVRGLVFVEGNTTVDLLHDFESALRPIDNRTSPYVFATMHRREFTESASRMHDVFSAFGRISDTICPVVFPIHPRTREAMRRHGISEHLLGSVEVVDPVSIFEALSYQRYATAVLTDSGCIQEEAYLLGTPCVTVRENTERHLTVEHGANVLTGFCPKRIDSATRWALDLSCKTWPPIYGSAGVGRRIVQRIAENAE